MGEDAPGAGQWPAERAAIRDRIAAARDHLTAAVENVLYELDEVEQLTGGGDDG